MPKQEGQKSKLLALLRIFEQQTDENHLLNVPQLVELLEAQGIRCERKSVYSDIEALGALGYDIKLRRGRGGGYFLASRTFDLAELKLLVDAVQASRVVSGTTSRRLIHKLEKLCSNYEGSSCSVRSMWRAAPRPTARACCTASMPCTRPSTTVKWWSSSTEKPTAARKRKGPSARGSWPGRTGATTSLPLPTKRASAITGWTR